jgi:hypothetical protein
VQTIVGRPSFLHFIKHPCVGGGEKVPHVGNRSKGFGDRARRSSENVDVPQRIIPTNADGDMSHIVRQYRQLSRDVGDDSTVAGQQNGLTFSSKSALQVRDHLVARWDIGIIIEDRVSN